MPAAFEPQSSEPAVESAESPAAEAEQVQLPTAPTDLSEEFGGTAPSQEPQTREEAVAAFSCWVRKQIADWHLTHPDIAISAACKRADQFSVSVLYGTSNGHAVARSTAEKLIAFFDGSVAELEPMLKFFNTGYDGPRRPRQSSRQPSRQPRAEEPTEVATKTSTSGEWREFEAVLKQLSGLMLDLGVSTLSAEQNEDGRIEFHIEHKVERHIVVR